VASFPTSNSQNSIQSGQASLCFRDLKGELIAAPLEWIPAWIEITGLAPEAAPHIHLWRNGQELEVLARRLKGAGDNPTKQALRLLAEWPRSGTGHYELRCRYEDELQVRTVSIASQKIAPEAYALLIEELETMLPASLALALQGVGGLAGVQFLPPSQSTIAQEWQRLQRAVCGYARRPGLAAVLHALASDPHQVLRTQELWMGVEKARRPLPSRLGWAVARPGNLQEFEGRAWRPRQVVEGRVEHSFDVFENRLLHGFYDQVQRRLQRLMRRLQQMAGQKLLAEQANQLLQRLRQARRAAWFLDSVPVPIYLPDRLTMVLLKRSPYRAALEGYIEFHRAVAVRPNLPLLEAPLENLPRLYQVWSTLHVLQALLEIAAPLGYQVQEQRLFHREAGGFYLELVPNGQPLVRLVHPEQGTRVCLIPERSYGRSGALRSVSFTQRPDIAIEIERPFSRVQVLLFDPKYKLDSELLAHSRTSPLTPAQASPEGEQWNELLQEDQEENQEYQTTVSEIALPGGKPKKIDIDKMHTYRDALQDAAHNAVVCYASILYPGPSVSYTPNLQALCAYPGHADGLRASIKRRLSEALT
jgi:hypothetical protein